MRGCLTEVEIFQTFRREMVAEEASAALFHVLACDLCREQWTRFALDQQVADGIRCAVQGDVTGADESPGVSAAVDLPEQLNIPGFRLRGDFIDGGQARVYRATHEASQEEVAIKVFHNSPLNEGGYARFSAELQSLARLRHPNVIPIRSAGEIVGHAYYVMPWIEGAPLDVYIREHELSCTECVAMMIKVCTAVEHAHKRGVMHLDLKPSNVRVDRFGEPLVMDFGLARFSTDEANDDLRSALGFAGTPAYMAPEQVRDKADVDTRTDVFMLGLLLFEVLSGRRARQGGIDRHERTSAMPLMPAPPLRSVLPGVHRELAAIVAKATHPVREQRYQGAEMLLDDLRRFRDHAPVQAMGEGFFYRFRKMSRRHLAGLTGCAAIFAILAIALMVRREADRMVDDSYRRVQMATEGRFHTTERSLVRAYDELAEVYRKLGDAQRAETYRLRATAMRNRIAVTIADLNRPVSRPAAKPTPAPAPATQ